MTAAVTDSRLTASVSGGVPGFGRLLRGEWTKIWSVRSTAWSLGILVIAAIGINTLITALTMGHWSSLGTTEQLSYRQDPTQFLGPGTLGVGQVPACVLGVMVMASEFATGMIWSSVLAVPRRLPMLAAKAVVYGGIILVAGELVAFPSFFAGQALIRPHVSISLTDPDVLRAVFGIGLYLMMIGLLSLAIGAILRHTAAAITVTLGLVLVISNLMTLVPGTAGKYISAYLPTNAGQMLVSSHQQAGDLLSSWQGFGVMAAWAAVLLAAAALLLKRRDL
jgi:ABC-2 type transport system permease protein